MHKAITLTFLGLLLVAASLIDLPEEEVMDDKSDEALVFVRGYGFVGEDNSRDSFPTDQVVAVSNDNKKEMVGDLWGRLYIRNR